MVAEHWGLDRARYMEFTGAEIVVKCLQEEQVEHVFGYPGGAVLYIYDEIFKQQKFKHVLVRHEQAAVHAADAYSRSSEKVGVCYDCVFFAMRLLRICVCVHLISLEYVARCLVYLVWRCWISQH